MPDPGGLFVTVLARLIADITGQFLVLKGRRNYSAEDRRFATEEPRRTAELLSF